MTGIVIHAKNLMSECIFLLTVLPVTLGYVLVLLHTQTAQKTPVQSSAKCLQFQGLVSFASIMKAIGIKEGFVCKDGYLRFDLFS